MAAVALDWSSRYLPAALGAYFGAGRCDCHCSAGHTGLGEVLAEVFVRCAPSTCPSRLRDFGAGLATGLATGAVLAIRDAVCPPDGDVLPSAAR